MVFRSRLNILLFISVCALGGRLIAKSRIMKDGVLQCHKNVTGPLFQLYCGQNATIEACAFFKNNNVSEFPAIPGLASNMFYGAFTTSTSFVNKYCTKD